MKKTALLLLVALGLGWTGCSSDSTVEVKNLRLEMKENPLGINVTQPRFSWQIASGKPDLKQTAYQIQVAASPEQLESGDGLLWDSGVVRSDESVLVPYAGKALESGKPYYWRVKLTTNQGDTPWSDAGRWSMALLDGSEWKASWIGEDSLSNPGEEIGVAGGNNKTRLAARYLRKEFTTDRAVERAVLYISGLGSYEAYLNGKKVSEDVFAPMPSLYYKRIYYNVYDVTALMAPDKNTLGVILGNGRFFSMRNPGMKTFGLPRLLAQLQIEYTDGSQETVASDTSWKITSKGPIIANNEFDGEEYDARLEMEGWNTNGFNDGAWKTPDVMEAPTGKLTAQQKQVIAEVTQKYNQASRQIDNLSEEKKNLNKKVTLAAQLDATNIRIEPRNKRGKVAKKVKDVVKLAISFTVVKNITAENGERTIYVRITKPDNDVLTKSASNTFPYENRTLVYSIKKYIEYNGEEQNINVFWDVEEFLYAGNYRVDIFEGGNLIGSQTFMLD